jgi:hypothetical protein
MELLKSREGESKWEKKEKKRIKKNISVSESNSLLFFYP